MKKATNRSRFMGSKVSYMCPKCGYHVFQLGKPYPEMRCPKCGIRLVEVSSKLSFWWTWN